MYYFAFIGFIYFCLRAAVFELLPLPFYVKGGASGVWEIGAVLVLWAAAFGLLIWGGWGNVPSQLKKVLPFLLLLIPVYMATSPVMNYGWRYLFPLLPWVFALAILGAISIKNGWVALLIAIPLTLSPMPRMVDMTFKYSEGLERAHVRLGRALSQVHPDNILLISDAGAVPYYSGLHTIDLCGLNNAEIARGEDYTGECAFVVLLSASKDSYVPMLEHEPRYQQMAVAAGMERLATLRFNDTYYLWLMGPSEARFLFVGLEDE
jgi:hypothetical protein